MGLGMHPAVLYPRRSQFRPRSGSVAPLLYETVSPLASLPRAPGHKYAGHLHGPAAVRRSLGAGGTPDSTNAYGYSAHASRTSSTARGSRPAIAAQAGHPDRDRERAAERVSVDRRILGRSARRRGGRCRLGQLPGDVPQHRARDGFRDRGLDSRGAVRRRRQSPHGQPRGRSDAADGRNHLGRAGRARLCDRARPAAVDGCRPRGVHGRAAVHARVLHQPGHGLRLLNVSGRHARRW